MALERDANLRRVGRPDHWDYPVAPGEQIYHHAIVGIRNGQLVPMDDAAGITCLGIALQSLAATAQPQRIRVDSSMWWLRNATDQAQSVGPQDVGGQAVALDDEFVARNGTTENNVQVGRIIDLSDDGEFVLVRIAKES